MLDPMLDPFMVPFGTCFYSFFLSPFVFSMDRSPPGLISAPYSNLAITGGKDKIVFIGVNSVVIVPVQNRNC
jgi:hypothetical protein